MGKAKAVTPGKPDKKSDRRLTRATRIQLYAARGHLGLDVLKETGLRMPVQVYFKDPRVAERFKDVGGAGEVVAVVGVEHRGRV